MTYWRGKESNVLSAGTVRCRRLTAVVEQRLQAGGAVAAGPLGRQSTVVARRKRRQRRAPAWSSAVHHAAAESRAAARTGAHCLRSPALAGPCCNRARRCGAQRRDASLGCSGCTYMRRQTGLGVELVVSIQQACPLRPWLLRYDFPQVGNAWNSGPEAVTHRCV